MSWNPHIFHEHNIHVKTSGLKGCTTTNFFVMSLNVESSYQVFLGITHQPKRNGFVVLIVNRKCLRGISQKKYQLRVHPQTSSLLIISTTRTSIPNLNFEWLCWYVNLGFKQQKISQSWVSCQHFILIWSFIGEWDLEKICTCPLLSCSHIQVKSAHLQLE